MNFFIRQNASEPILKMELIDDGKNDKSFYHDLLEKSMITFDMYDIKTGDPMVLGGRCNLTTRTKKFNFITDEYYITYRFSEYDTMIKGKYEGIITIQFLDTDLNPTTKLIVPIREKLFINVI